MKVELSEFIRNGSFEVKTFDSDNWPKELGYKVGVLKPRDAPRDSLVESHIHGRMLGLLICET